jgi:hypothetical protein
MMHSPAIGVGYFFWRRLRWPLAGMLAYALLLAVLAHVFAHAEFLPAIQMIGAIPIVFATVHFLGVFTYGPSDFGASPSGFPRYMLVQPARAASLVGWPMLYGTVTVGLLWALIFCAMLGPSELSGPAAPYGAFFVAALAWFQVAAWCSFPVPIIRAIFTICAIILLVVAGAAMKYFEFSRAGIISGYLAITLAAYGFGVFALWRARHGEGQTWNIMALFDFLTSALPRRTSFPSARRAQLWYELRRNSLYLPGMTLLMFIPMLLPLLGKANHPLSIAEHSLDTRMLVLLTMIACPICFAAAVSMALGKFDFWSNKVPSFTPFFATRAFSTSDFIVTKWLAAAVSTLLVWFLVLLFVAIFGLTSTAAERSRIYHVLGGGPGVAIARFTLIAALLMFITWKNQVMSFFVPMFGRAWFTITMALVGWLQIAALAVGGYCVVNFPAVRDAAKSLGPWVIYGVALVKIVIAIAVVRILRQRAMPSASGWRKVSVIWAGGGIALFAILCVLVGPRALLIPVVILMLPMVRIALAPLTLSLNRHR